jgi:hypothetical protein
MTINFGYVRNKALNLWLTGTGRKLIPHRNLRYDDFSFNDYECKWQQLSWNINGDEWHVSHFCSLGEWASNITDILDDGRFDMFTFQNGKDKSFLYRHYTRYMLLVLEMINDFVDILKLADINLASKTQRKNSLSTITDVNELTNFINSACKHKADERNGKHIHFHNHHLPIWFEDIQQPHPFHSPISRFQAIQVHPDGILIPSIVDLTQIIIDGYKVLDYHFLNAPNKFSEFASKHGAQYSESS